MMFSMERLSAITSRIAAKLIAARGEIKSPSPAATTRDKAGEVGLRGDAARGKSAAASGGVPGSRPRERERNPVARIVGLKAHHESKFVGAVAHPGGGTPLSLSPGF